MAEKVWNFRGAYLLAQGNEIITLGGCGFADEKNNKRNEPETKFLIGSLTKSFTAVAIMQLAEKGLVNINDDFTKYIDIYPTIETTHITIHDLLCHRSGIPDVLSNPDFGKKIHDSISVDELVSFFANEPLLYEPGSHFAYSSSNYILLGLVIESVTGMAWAEYIDSNICKPAGMTNTGVINNYTDRDDFAKGYFIDNNGISKAVPAVHPSLGYSAGALSSTVTDLFKLNLALYDATLLTKSSIDELLKAHSYNYGYGWQIYDFGNYRLTAHGGGAPGYASILQRWLDDSICVVVLSNNSATSVHTIANGLASIALGQPYELPKIKRPNVLSLKDLSEYEGKYAINQEEIRTINIYRDNLFMNRNFGPGAMLLPEKKDNFYLAFDQMTTVNFLRNSSNEIYAYILRQAFNADTAWKINQEN